MRDFEVASLIIVVALETAGAASFAQAVLHDKPVSITVIDTIAKSLGARQVSQGTLDLRERYGKDKVRSLVVSDEQALDALVAFANSHRMLVEPACGAALAPIGIANSGANILQSLVPELSSESTVVVEVCGGFAVTLEMIEKWKFEFV